MNINFVTFWIIYWNMGDCMQYYFNVEVLISILFQPKSNLHFKTDDIHSVKPLLFLSLCEMMWTVAVEEMQTYDRLYGTGGTHMQMQTNPCHPTLPTAHLQGTCQHGFLSVSSAGVWTLVWISLKNHVKIESKQE